MLHLPILVGNMVPKHGKGLGGNEGDTPGMKILTAGEEIVPTLDVDYEDGIKGGGRCPCGTYLPTEEYVYLCPPFS